MLKMLLISKTASLYDDDDILGTLRVWHAVRMALTTPSRRFKSKTTISGFSSSIFRATYIGCQLLYAAFAVNAALQIPQSKFPQYPYQQLPQPNPHLFPRSNCKLPYFALPCPQDHLLSCWHLQVQIARASRKHQALSYRFQMSQRRIHMQRQAERN